MCIDDNAKIDTALDQLKSLTRQLRQLRTISNLKRIRSMRNKIT